MIRFLAAVAAVLLMCASTAHADRAAADACAASLPPVSKAMYDKSLPEVLGGKKIVDSLRANARSMVMGGAVSRTDARPAAEAAGGCLKLAK